ncbi:MAG TPA: N-acetylmuramoyl-L-alanine amidase [Bryobacteraceae bacterium]|nr:N-acetylmuramoyl-L-alanine amidase [Bryobacteraceae bacterium]
MSRIRVKNKLKPSENVASAGVAIVQTGPPPVTLSGTTNSLGVLNLAVNTLANGTHAFAVVPASTTTDLVGPAVASSPTPGDRVFRSLGGTVTVAAGAITAVTIPPAERVNGDATLVAGGNIDVVLQPVWMKSPNNSGRGTSTITMIIVHHTGGPVVGPAINTFLSTGEGTSAHYVIDTDGAIVKMVQEGRRAHHAGEARWAGQSDINSVSIGIEIVNSTGTYPAAQYTALLDLIGRLRGAHPTIVDWNIIGHSDIATTNGKLGRKSSDPGLQFEWSRLEGRGWGMRSIMGPFPTAIYAGFFAAFPAETLRKNDNDAKRVLGGAKRTTIVGNPVRELQDDLTEIGYHLGTPDGDFGDKTRAAVQMFQEHFFAGGRGHKSPDGKVDNITAQMIKGVVGAKP